MATDGEFRGIVLATTYESRHANTGWVPITTETFSGFASLNINAVATICEHLKQADLIEWRPSSRGPGAGMARITGHGVDVVEGSAESRINVVLPSRFRPAQPLPHHTSDPSGFQSGTFQPNAFQGAAEANRITDPALSRGARVSNQVGIYRAERIPEASGELPGSRVIHAVVGESVHAEDGSSATVIRSPNVAALHQEMLSRIEALEAIMAAMRTRSTVGIGHNHPPEPIEGIAFGENDWRELDAAVLTLKKQPISPLEFEEGRRAAGILESITDRLWKEFARARAYSANKLDLFVTEVIKSAGKEVGKRLPQAYFWWPLISTLYAVSHAAHLWLAALPH